MPRWGMVIDVRRCIGCQACTVACKMENLVPLGVWRTEVRYYEKGVYPKVKRHFFPIMCDHCESAPCVDASENNGVGSFYKDEKTGMVLINYNKLKGRTKAQIKAEAEAAIEACPIERVFINPLTNLPEKCTFCYHRVERGLTTACAETCLGRARVFGDLSDPDSPASLLLAENATRTLMPNDDGGGAAVYYIGLEAGMLDYGAVVGGRQVDPTDFDTGKLSMGGNDPNLHGWTPETPVRSREY